MDIHHAQNQHHHNEPEQEMKEQVEIIPPLEIISYTKISNIKEAKIMLFQAMEDKKYICRCPAALNKCSLDIRPPLNEVVWNFAVVLSPSLKGNNQPFLPSQLTIHPSTNPLQINRATCFVIWNIRGANHDEFKWSFRDIINTHNPCMVALLETRMTIYSPLKDSFNFTNILEVPDHG